MAGLNTEVNQVGDICPHCKEQKLVYIGGSYPYSEEHLECYNGCNSTFNIKYKQMWNEDTNSLCCSMLDVLEEEFKKRGMKLTDEKSDELYDKVQEMLEEFSTQDYRNYN